MYAALKLTNAALALGIILFSFASNALVSPKEEVAEATQAWALALGEDDPDKVLPLYADDAVLWGTLSPTVRSDRAALRDYFVTAFRVRPGLKVAFITGRAPHQCIKRERAASADQFCRFKPVFGVQERSVVGLGFSLGAHLALEREDRVADPAARVGRRRRDAGALGCSHDFRVLGKPALVFFNDRSHVPRRRVRCAVPSVGRPQNPLSSAAPPSHGASHA